MAATPLESPTRPVDRLIPTETNPSSLTDERTAGESLSPNSVPESVGAQSSQGVNHSEHKKSGAEEKKELMEKMQPPKGSHPVDKAQQKGDRWEKDPTTGTDVLIRDAQFSDFRDKGLNNEALDPGNPKAGTARRPPSDPSARDTRYPAPAPAEPGNICLQSFPPPVDPVDVKHAKNIMRTGAIISSVLCFIIWFVTATGKHVSWIQFIWRSFLVGSAVGISWIAAENAGRKIEKELERVRMNMHIQRGETYSPSMPESAEWLNALLKVVWGLINPQVFTPMVDMVEDTLQASLPSFVNAVRITDIGQGTNPVRIVSMRALPDQRGRPVHPQEGWAGSDKDRRSKDQAGSGDSDDTPNQIDSDETGDHLNYEISVSYQALPGQRSKLRFHNIHLMLEFFFGVWDWFKVPIPFYAIIEGFVATIRMRVQFVQNPPFVRNLTVTFMGVPKIDVSVEPFTKKLPNMLDLPVVQNFVGKGLAAACAEFVAPKSLTINLAQLLLGSGVKKDTKALGVFVVQIHYADQLAAQDRGGKSDPYIVLAYAKFGKPLHSTRIITSDLNPVWEETAFLLVSEDEVKGQEDLSAMLWDSDKRTADDLVGRVNIPVLELMNTPNKMISRVDKLRGFQDANDMPGTLHWEIGYYPKVPLNTALRKDLHKDANAPIQDKPTIADTQAEADALNTPPDPDIPTGILSVIINQIHSLERQDIKGSTGSREGHTGQDTSQPAEEGQNLPNSYCEIIINDDMIYKTRVKQYSSMPYFEAGTERFVRNWQNTVVRVQVRDARMREKDPVLGIVTVKLADLFKDTSAITRLFSLQEGIGYGRADISFVFRQVKTDLPPTLFGWETGTLEIPSGVRIEPTSEFAEGFSTQKLEIYTTEESYKVPSNAARIENGSVYWDIPVEKVRLPVYNRYSSAVVFEIGSGGVGPVGQASDFMAVYWFKDMQDDEETQIRIPVLQSKDLKQLRQNYINEQTAKSHDYEVVGWLSCTLILDSGLDPDHEQFQRTRDDTHRYEAFDRADGQARIAERTQRLQQNGEPSRKDQKEIDNEKDHQLHMRHRGVMQYKAARTVKWSKEGLKKRAGAIKDMITGSSQDRPRNRIETEA